MVNPGSTSTKLALYAGERLRVGETIRHDAARLRACGGPWEQFDLRWQAVDEWSSRHAREVAAVAAIGGMFRPLEGGTYAVNQHMLADARGNLQGEHVSNLGCELAARLAARHGCPAYVVDPVSVDEFDPVARYSGHPAIERRSLSHALSLHATARRAAVELGMALAESRLIVAHLGGGISVAPVRGGRIIDVNDASSDGPFSPERTGGLPLQPFLSLCFSQTAPECETRDGKMRERGMRKMVMGRGGLVAYLGTNSAVEVEKRIAGGDQQARDVYEAMAYQIAKEIGAMATVLEGRLHGIVLAGGLAASAMLVEWIRRRVEFLAPVLVYAGEDEMGALAAGALRVIRGEEAALEY